MITAEQAKQEFLVALLDAKEVETSVLQEKTGLDVYTFNGVVNDLIAEGFITQTQENDITKVAVTAKGLNYLLKLKASEVKESVKSSETAKTLKVVGKVAGKKLNALGGKINKASDKFTDLLILKAKELEEAKANKKAGITPDVATEDFKESEESEIIAKIIAAHAELTKASVVKEETSDLDGLKDIEDFLKGTSKKEDNDLPRGL